MEIEGNRPAFPVNVIPRRQIPVSVIRPG